MKSSLDAVKRAYADEVGAAANVPYQPIIEAFAAVPRERFLFAGPWRLPLPATSGVEETPDDDPRHIYVDRLVTLALPRTRDFKGVSRKAFDGKGNYTLGLREQIIFPEINYDRIDIIKGLNVSIVTTARTDEEGRALLQHLGMPFRAA